MVPFIQLLIIERLHSKLWHSDLRHVYISAINGLCYDTQVAAYVQQIRPVLLCKASLMILNDIEKFLNVLTGKLNTYLIDVQGRN